MAVRRSPFGVGESQSSVLALADGKFVLLWSAPAGPESFPRVFARFHDDDGRAVADDVAVSSRDPTGPQVLPQGTVLRDGSFITVWRSFDAAQEGCGPSIWLRRFSQDGLALDQERMLHRSRGEDEFDHGVAVLGDGSAVVVWSTTQRSSPPQWSVVGRLYAAQSRSLGRALVASAPRHTYCCDPTVVPLEGQKFVVAWRSSGSLPGGFESHVRVFDAAQAAGWDLLPVPPLNGTDTGLDAAAALAAPLPRWYS